jgi:hypothetical protein
LQLELQKMERELRSKMRGVDLPEQTALEREEEVKKKAERTAELEFQLRADLASGRNDKDSGSSSSSSDNEEEAKKKPGEGRKQVDEYDYSSGIESDNDVDLLVEQDMITAMKLKKELKIREEDDLRKKGELPSIDEQIVIGKEDAKRVWEKTLASMPDEYDFVIRTYSDGFPKGS